MRRAQWLVLVLLVMTAGGALAYTSAQVRSGDWPVLLLLALAVAVSARLSLTDFSAGELSFLCGGVMLAFVVGGPHVALWAIALGLFTEGLLWGGQSMNQVFNLAEILVTSAVSFAVYAALGGGPGNATAFPVQTMVMALVFMLTNAALYSIYLHLDESMPVCTALKTMLDDASVRAYLIVMLVGILGGVAFVQGGPIWGAIAMGLAYLLHSSLRRYFQAVKQALSQALQLEVVLNATKGALVMTDRSGVIQVVNRQVGVLLGVEPAELVGQLESDVPQLRWVKEQVGERDEQVVELAGETAQSVHWYRATVPNQQGELQGYIEVFTDVTALRQAEENLRELYDSTIRTLTAAIDARDSYTHGHSDRVSAYSVTVAARMGLPQKDLERIRYAGLLHDIGKVGIDDRVLRKCGPLTPSERAMMMQHPVIGAEVLQKAEILADLIPGVRWHHEWVSGGGYPDGLVGEEIPLDARIIGVADALDAMTSDRPYRPAMPLEEALRRIRENAGVQFAPEVVNALLEVVEDGELVVRGISIGQTAAAAELEGGIRPVHGQELSILYQLSREDYATLSLDEALRRFLNTLHDTVGPNVYMVYLTDQESGQMTCRCAVGLTDRDLCSAKDLRLVKEAVGRETPVVVKDTALLAEYRPAAAATRSEAVIPLVIEGEPPGALVVEANLTGYFSNDMLYLLEALGEKLCSSIKLLRYHEQLARAATHDGLTGVYNHSFFYERLTEEMRAARKSGRPVSLALFDLVGLKVINVEYGHEAGNAALCEFARVLRQSVRQMDVVARYGGDEFAVILPGAGPEEAARIASRVTAAMERSFLHGGRVLWLPGATCGLACFPQDGARPTELVLQADRAMNREKQIGSKGGRDDTGGRDRGDWRE